MTLDERVIAVIAESMKAGVLNVRVLYRGVRALGIYEEKYHQFIVDLKQVEEDLHLSTPEVVVYKLQFEKKRGKNNVLRDELINHDPPYTLKEIAVREAKKTGRKVTSQAISEYLKKSDFYESWKSRRNEHKKILIGEKNTKSWGEEERQFLCNYLPHALEERRPKIYAAFYYYGCRGIKSSKRVPLDKLERLFEVYFHAKQRGVKLSLEELGRPEGMPLMTVRNILKCVGEEAMYGSHERKITPVQKKEALRRSINIYMNASDIAYFIEVPNYVAYQIMKLYGKKKRNNFGLLYLGSSGFSRKGSSYRQASEVYEAVDLGFTPAEVLQLTDLPQKVYNILMEKRSNIKPKITTALRTIYNAHQHTVPYVTAELRKKL